MHKYTLVKYLNTWIKSNLQKKVVWNSFERRHPGQHFHTNNNNLTKINSNNIIIIIITILVMEHLFPPPAHTVLCVAVRLWRSQCSPTRAALLRDLNLTLTSPTPFCAAYRHFNPTCQPINIQLTYRYSNPTCHTILHVHPSPAEVWPHGFGF